MAANSKIEWTEHTWNPIVGCSIVSPGCTNCYAMRMAARLEAMAGTCAIEADDARQQYYGTTKKVNGNAVWTGVIRLAPEHVLLAPLRRKKPTTYFVNSMGDLFHEDAPDEWIDKVFAVMALCPQHTFQVLTKRADRMLDYMTDPDDGRGHFCTMYRVWNAAVALDFKKHLSEEQTKWLDPDKIDPLWPLPNVWLGVSCERQQEADERIPHLLQTPAAVRFISAEPLLGPIDLTAIEAPDKVEGERWTFNALTDGDYYTLQCDEGRTDSGDWPYREHALDWVIVGGESGPNARIMSIEHARSLRDQCAAAGVSFFFKQWGAHAPVGHVDRGEATDPSEYGYKRVGKKAAGRLLDGKEHSNYPKPAVLAAALLKEDES